MCIYDGIVIKLNVNSPENYSEKKTAIPLFTHILFKSDSY